jgi:hypothetical protein
MSSSEPDSLLWFLVCRLRSLTAYLFLSRVQGTFLWISTVLYLVVEPWILQVLSLGTANPTKDSVKLRLIPGFCPGDIFTRVFLKPWVY